MKFKFLKTAVIFIAVLTTAAISFAQPVKYSVSNTHSHNDYEHAVPFYNAYYAGFGSIEVDVILINNQLYVAHDTADVKPNRTLQSLYLDPLAKLIRENNGHIYKDPNKKLLLLIDQKSTAEPSLKKLLEVLAPYNDIINCSALKLVITGNQPAINTFTTYPSYIYFDGNLKNNYTPAQLERIGLFSDNLRIYTKWNGKGIPVKADRDKIEKAVAAVHALNKPIRFWAAPDLPNAWYQLMHFKVDYINTDKIPELATFLNTLHTNSFTSERQQPVYKPTYRYDKLNQPVKNIILLIGDGMGLAHIYAAYTANRGQLNILNMRSMGFSKTDAADSYITDSGGGGTAMATGQKTNNRFIGVGPSEKPLVQLPAMFKKQNKSTALITTGDVTDATPASFYAHNNERDSSVMIAGNFLASAVDLLMGSDSNYFSRANDSLIKVLQKNKVNVLYHAADKLAAGSRNLVLDKSARLTKLAGRGNFLETAMQQSLNYLNQNKQGYFLMAEGAKIDAGGHYNNLPIVVTELLDFDAAVGNAMQWADTHPGTLVIVTADHETGGLTLLDGDIKKGYVSGHFATEDHTAITVPVFAYGPRSNLFNGFYNNTEIYNKILQALQ